MSWRGDRTGRDDPLGRVLDVVDLEADVMQTYERLPELCTCRVVGLELQDREVDGAVAQDVPVVGLALGRPQAREVEHVDVELRGRVRVVGGNCKMAELGHRALLGRRVRTVWPLVREPRVDLAVVRARRTWTTAGELTSSTHS